MTSKFIDVGFSNISPMFHDDTEYALRTAWMRRSRELIGQQLQDHADVLYVDFATDFLAKRKTFADALLEKIRTASGPQDLHVPLYTFHVCHAAEGKVPYSAYLHGWHTSLVATVRDDDGYEETVLDRKSLYQIFGYTDVLKRLALLWGGREFWIDFQRTGRTIAEEPGFVVHEYAVRLHYWPRGLPAARIAELKAVQEKYVTHSPYYPARLQSDYGTLASLATPPRMTSSLHAPGAPARHRPLAVRTNGGGIPFPSLDSDSE